MNKSKIKAFLNLIDKPKHPSSSRFFAYILLIMGVFALNWVSNLNMFEGEIFDKINARPSDIFSHLYFFPAVMISISISKIINSYDKYTDKIFNFEKKLVETLNLVRIKVKNEYALILIDIASFLFCMFSVIFFAFSISYSFVTLSEFSKLFEFGSHYGFKDDLFNSSISLLLSYVFLNLIFVKPVEKEDKDTKKIPYSVIFGMIIPSLIFMLPFTPGFSENIINQDEFTSSHFSEMKFYMTMMLGLLTIAIFLSIIFDEKPKIDWKKAIFASATSYTLILLVVFSINNSVIDEMFDKSKYERTISINNKEFTYKPGNVALKENDFFFALEAYDKNGLLFINAIDGMIYYSKNHEDETIRAIGKLAQRRYQLIEDNKEFIEKTSANNLKLGDFITLYIAKIEVQKQVYDENLVYNLASIGKYQEAADIYLNKLMNSEMKFVPIEGKEVKYLTGRFELPSMMALIIASGKASLDTSKIQDQETKEKWEKELNRVSEIHNGKKPSHIRLTPEEAEEIRNWF
ncbi:hypothetical protein J8A87_24485 [Vibrio parahaemolyticus]|uniref:hypothetical protein n=1 Tax=Vibrio sp. Vb0587 TaxID=3074626 RepID=UPI002964424E|nr:hypothetical protein [Vibrio sp. Vb0587]MBE4779279.1 hypothetical protein [Vibrio parahaemolyticus]MCF9167583.1 hypothetical protein [Vibrio parahaemolyticus]MDW1964120.1 hypothetical protein [Vibrio sp. Vb0587]